MPGAVGPGLGRLDLLGGEAYIRRWAKNVNTT